MISKCLTIAALALPLLAVGPEPILKVDAVAAKAKLTAAQKEKVAPIVTRLNIQLEKAVTLHAAAKKKTHDQAHASHKAHADHGDMQAIHEQMMKLYEELKATLTPEQLQAVMTYVHEQIKTSGLDPSHFGKNPHHGVQH